MMANPFRYGIVVDEPYFIDRKGEIRDFQQWLKSSQRLMVYSPRRFGKTSLILKVLKNLRQEGYHCVYLDFFKVHSRARFAELYYDAIIRSMSSFEKAVKKISALVRSIHPVLSFDHFGNPNISVQFDAPPGELDLTGVFDLPQKLADEKPWIVVFDEFQDIGKLNGEHFEKELRAALIHHDKVGYVFMGSQRHMLLNMFTQRKRAFYRFGQLYELKKIPPEVMQDHLMQMFRDTGFSPTGELCGRIIEISNNIPHYVQYLASAVWEKGREKEQRLDQEVLEEAVNKIVTNQNDYFFSLYDRLTAYQQKVLRAVQVSNKNILSAEFSMRFRLSTPSSIQRAMQRLEKDGILERHGRAWYFTDPFFNYWLQAL